MEDATVPVENTLMLVNALHRAGVPCEAHLFEKGVHGTSTVSYTHLDVYKRQLLGDRFDVLYAAPQETAERGVTVSALRSSPERFAAKADFPLEASPFCKAAFVVHQPDFKPGRHPYYHAGVFYSQEPSASSAAPLLGVQPGMRVLDMCAAPGGKSSQLAAALQGLSLIHI